MKKKKKETQSFGVRRNYDNRKSTLSEFLAQQKQEKKNFSKVIPKMYVNTFNLPHFAYCINYCICMFYTKTNNYASFFCVCSALSFSVC